MIDHRTSGTATSHEPCTTRHISPHPRYIRNYRAFPPIALHLSPHRLNDFGGNSRLVFSVTRPCLILTFCLGTHSCLRVHEAKRGARQTRRACQQRIRDIFAALNHLTTCMYSHDVKMLTHVYNLSWRLTYKIITTYITRIEITFLIWQIITE